jgi:putative addiction module component (TIGR02574 family)
MSVVEDIRSQALELSTTDRAGLARDLILSLEESSDYVGSDTEWPNEIEERAKTVASGEFTAFDWQESVDRIRAALATRRNS